MAKTFFLAESFYRYRTLIFHDHGTSSNLAGVDTRRGTHPGHRQASHPQQPGTADVTHPEMRDKAIFLAIFAKK